MVRRVSVSPFRRFTGAATVVLAEPDYDLFVKRDFIDVLRRRSHRVFDRGDLDRAALATLLKLAAGPLPHADGRLAADGGSVFYLLAAGPGVRVTFTAALRDESVEELLGCDPVEEIVLGTSVLGTEPR
jgi:hypothetical protein